MGRRRASQPHHRLQPPLLPLLLLLAASTAVSQAPVAAHLPHSRQAFQPACRAYVDTDGTLICSVNPLALASQQLGATSLAGRSLLQTAARQVACGRHGTLTGCLRDRDNFCAPMTRTFFNDSLDCVVGGMEWTAATLYFTAFLATYSCPGSSLDRLWKCFFVLNPFAGTTQTPATYNTTAEEFCRLAGCAAYAGPLDYDDLNLAPFCVPEALQNLAFPALVTLSETFTEATAGNCSIARAYLSARRQIRKSGTNALRCPLQWGVFDPVIRQCTLNVFNAPASLADDFMSQYFLGAYPRLCSGRLRSYEYCEGEGLGVRPEDLIALPMSVPDTDLLEQFLEIDVDGLIVGNAAARTILTREGLRWRTWGATAAVAALTACTWF